MAERVWSSARTLTGWWTRAVSAGSALIGGLCRHKTNKKFNINITIPYINTTVRSEISYALTKGVGSDFHVPELKEP
jgi:hypothetical protein